MPFNTDMSDSLVWVMRRDNPKIAANGVIAGAKTEPESFCDITVFA